MSPAEQLVPLQPEHAVQGLLKWMNTDTHLVCLGRIPKEFETMFDSMLGPLTNVALALLMDVTFASRFHQSNMTIMGGAHYGQGNTTYSSEFNVYVPPYTETS